MSQSCKPEDFWIEDDDAFLRILMTMTQQKSGQEDRLNLDLILYYFDWRQKINSFGADAMNLFTRILLGTLVLLSNTSAFQVSLPSRHRSTYIMILPKAAPQRQYRSKFFVQRSFSPLSASSDDKENVPNGLGLESSDSMPVIVRGSEEDDLGDGVWDDIETGQPPQWMVMKELLGINIFTYLLGALITFFLGMNYFLGPGWLGQGIGIPGTGSINDVSNSLPDVFDLSRPDYRL